MTLVYQNYKPYEPGIHALIVGVSAYRHLPEGSEKMVHNPSSMTQLSSPANSAYLFYQWLINNTTVFAQPIQSIRLLLAKSSKDKYNLSTDACTRENFKREFIEWKEDASTKKENITLFYFAGHGIQVDTNKSTILLMEDFGEEPDYLLEKGVGIDNILDLMRPTKEMNNIARTQIYFVDCCRTSHPDLENIQDPQAPPLKPVGNSKKVRDDRLLPVFYSTTAGAQAFEHTDGSLTFFTQALFECLNGRAAEKTKHTVTGEEQWTIGVYRLCRVLNELLKRDMLINKNRKKGKFLALTTDYDQPVRLEGSTKDFTICKMATSPKVKVTLSISPSHALNHTKVTVKHNALTEVNNITHPLNPHPYETEWEAGMYLLHAEVVSVGKGYQNFGPELCELSPDKDFNWEARMK